jgi:signal peptidase I
MSDMPDQPSRSVGDEQAAMSKSGTTKGIYKVIRDWAIVIVLALFAAFVVRTFLLQQFYISGPSMESTLYQNNRVLVNKIELPIFRSRSRRHRCF